MNEETRERVHEYIDELDRNERVSIDNFVRFSSVYDRVHTLMRGIEPFAIKTRRAFNRHRKIGIVDENPDYAVFVLAAAIAAELDPEYDWLEYA